MYSQDLLIDIPNLEHLLFAFSSVSVHTLNGIEL